MRSALFLTWHSRSPRDRYTASGLLMNGVDSTNSGNPGNHTDPDAETHLENRSVTCGAYSANSPPIEYPAMTLSSVPPRIPSAYGTTSSRMYAT